MNHKAADHYSLSKTALHGVLRYLHSSFKKSGVRILGMHPGLMKTKIVNYRGSTEPHQVSELFLDWLFSEPVQRNSHISGKLYRASGIRMDL